MEIALLPVSDGMVSMLLLGVCGIALLLASVTDLKTREVPDMLNYGLVFFGIFINTLLSALFGDYRFLLNSALGLGVGFGIGWVMFYAGQWGGGDSKMLMGLGATIGMPLHWGDSFLLALLLNILFAGAAYGLLWSIFLVFRNRRRFSSAFARLTSGKMHHTARFIILALIALALVLLIIPIHNVWLKWYLLWLLVIVPLMYYVWLLVKAIEKSCMMVSLPVRKLTEGDWIAKDVVIRGTRVCGPKDLGISKRQIALLRGYERRGLVKKILVKQGIPFIPSFLLAFAFTLAWGNPLALLVGLL